MSLEVLEENPFYVLELRPGATAMEIERAGQRLLAMLTVGLADAATYPTPLGPRPRDADRVRSATAILRDPQQRETAAFWAMIPPDHPLPELPTCADRGPLEALRAGHPRRR